MPLRGAEKREEQPDRRLGWRLKPGPSPGVAQSLLLVLPALQVGLAELGIALTSPSELTQQPEPLLPRLSRRLLCISSRQGQPSPAPQPPASCSHPAGWSRTPQPGDSGCQQAHGTCLGLPPSVLCLRQPLSLPQAGGVGKYFVGGAVFKGTTQV